MRRDPSSLGTARKHNGKHQILLRGTVLALLIAAGLVLFLGLVSPSGAEEPPPPETPAKADPIPAINQKANEYRVRADYWGHKLHTHVPHAHNIITPSKSVSYEIKRRNAWLMTAKRYEAMYRDYVGDLQRCRRAGFPRWYCPILLKAATKKGVPYWTWDSNLVFIITHEGGFNPHAANPRSTAYGMYQMLTETSSDPYVQTLNGIRYIQGRYGTPAGAASFWHKHNWY